MPPDPEEIADLVLLTIERALAPALTRLTAAETTLAHLGDVRDRVLALEHPPAGPDAEIREALAALSTTTADLRVRLQASETTTRGSIEALLREYAIVRERVAVAEVRALVPGPAGADGADGRDGLGFEDFEESFDGERTFTRRFVREGKVLREFSWTVPYVLDRGVYQSGKEYAQGDGVTWGGSFWIAQAPTSAKPGEGATPWRLAVKAGRAGKDAAAA